MTDGTGNGAMRGPCDDIRVIDLSSGPVGGIATMMLADYGADVIKVERPGGDPLRRLTASPVCGCAASARSRSTSATRHRARACAS